MGGKFLPDPLGIHIVKVFSDNVLTHVTKQTFVEHTITEICLSQSVGHFKAPC